MSRILLLLILLAPTAWARVNRIVSLAPGLTETVCALGRFDALVGVTNYCTFPEEVKGLPKVGGYIDPNLEIIVTMRPDLVLTLPEQQDAANKLTRLGMNVATIRNYSINDIQAAVLKIGDLIDRRAEAETMVAELKQRGDHLSKQRRPRPKVLIALGHELRDDAIKEIYIVGRKGYLNEILTLAGGENIYPLENPHFPKLSHETLLRYDPDVIIDLVPKNKLTPAEEKAHREPWLSIERLSAVREGRYHLITQEFVLQAGPRYIETLARISAILDQSSHGDDQ